MTKSILDMKNQQVDLIVTGSMLHVPFVTCTLGEAASLRLQKEGEWLEDGYRQPTPRKDPHLWVKGKHHWRRCMIRFQDGRMG